MSLISRASLLTAIFSSMTIFASEFPRALQKKTALPTIMEEPEMEEPEENEKMFLDEKSARKKAESRIIKSLRQYAQKPDVAANISYKKGTANYKNGSYDDALTTFETIDSTLLPKSAQPSYFLYKMATALQLSDDQENYEKDFSAHAYNSLDQALILFDKPEYANSCDLSLLGANTESLIQAKTEHIITTNETTDNAYEWCYNIGRLYIKTPAVSTHEKERRVHGVKCLQYAARNNNLMYLLRVGCLTEEDLPLTTSLEYLMTIDRSENNDHSQPFQIARHILTKRIPDTISEQYWLFSQYTDTGNHVATQKLLFSIFALKIISCNLDISTEEKNRLVQHCSENALLLENSKTFMQSPKDATPIQQVSTAFLALVYCHSSEPHRLVKAAQYLTQLIEIPRFKMLKFFLADVYHSLGLQAPNHQIALGYFVRGTLLNSKNMVCFTEIAKDLVNDVVVPGLSDQDIARLLPSAPNTPEVEQLRKTFTTKVLKKKQPTTKHVLNGIKTQLQSSPNYHLLAEQDRSQYVNESYGMAVLQKNNNNPTLMNRLAKLKHPHACLVNMAKNNGTQIKQQLQDCFSKGIVKKEDHCIFIDGTLLEMIYLFIMEVIDDDTIEKKNKREVLETLVSSIQEHGINMAHFYGLIKEVGKTDLEAYLAINK